MNVKLHTTTTHRRTVELRASDVISLLRRGVMQPVPDNARVFIVGECSPVVWPGGYGA